ncbi:hypothetical protein [Larkinella soli]|uniref:hypothetical protein n=1 Tax=Larkinella soli TaxID=1770527 RepID=UPI000FFC26ED|nr:hypothetical protein [Larkinella soli]
MKIILKSCLLLLTVAACSSENGRESDPSTRKPEPTYTLIFLDKSRSVNENKTFVTQKYQQAINDIVEQNIHTKGDKLEVYLIHENTSKARALSLTTRSELEVADNANATDQEAAQTAFDLSLGREKAAIRQRVLQQLATPNHSASGKETDIQASLPVIARANESGAAVKIYYLSDMVESVYRAGRRDFHKTPPKDNAQAETWAKADAEKLKQYTIGSPDITMILPFEPNASVKQNNPAVTQYWQTLFQELGAGNVEEQ